MLDMILTSGEMNSQSLNKSNINNMHNDGNCKDTVNANLITIHEMVNLTKSQYEVLKTICDTYEQSISEYMHEALIEAMKFDITEGNFSDILLGKLEEDNKQIESLTI